MFNTISLIVNTLHNLKFYATNKLLTTLKCPFATAVGTEASRCVEHKWQEFLHAKICDCLSFECILLTPPNFEWTHPFQAQVLHLVMY